MPCQLADHVLQSPEGQETMRKTATKTLQPATILEATCAAAEDATGAAVGTVAPVCTAAAVRAPAAVFDGATAVAGNMAEGAGTAAEVLRAALDAGALLPAALTAGLVCGAVAGEGFF